MEASSSSPDIGFVVIGRNEGLRLQAALTAIQTLSPLSPVVYVDSGSTDGSVEFARSLNMQVICLDMSVPFTAARARNAGFFKLVGDYPDLNYIQFMDGDCELQAGWIESAIQALSANDTTAIVSGRRVEKYPEASVYNTLMDIEWNTPVGETLAVLGDMCVKTSVFKEINGFNSSIIAAEDDDVCLRAHKAGYKIYRIDAVMSYHDANIMHLSQWYRRSKRGGHGYANINHLHGQAPEYYFRKALISVCVWGAVVPILFLLFLVTAPTLAFLILLVYCAFITRTSLRRLRQGFSKKISFMYGFLIFTGKVPEFLGAFQYWKNHLLARNHQLIEYK